MEWGIKSYNSQIKAIRIANENFQWIVEVEVLKVLSKNMLVSWKLIQVEVQVLLSIVSNLNGFLSKNVCKTWNPNPTTIIIGDLWITELDTVTLFVRHGQMTHFGVYPWVFSFSIWPGQGFYVELFSIYAFASEYQTKMKRTFRLE